MERGLAPLGLGLSLIDERRREWHFYYKFNEEKVWFSFFKL